MRRSVTCGGRGRAARRPSSRTALRPPVTGPGRALGPTPDAATPRRPGPTGRRGRNPEGVLFLRGVGVVRPLPAAAGATEFADAGVGLVPLAGVRLALQALDEVR